MSEKPIPPPTCKVCGKKLNKIHVSTYTTLIWNGNGDTGKYENDPTTGDAEERCPNCDSKFPIKGEDGAVDFTKQRRKTYRTG